jgi:hypothetical protein
VTTDYMFSDGTPLPPDPLEHLNGHAVAVVEPTTWEPVDLGPYLRGEVVRPQPSVGIARSDGLRLLYPGKEHAVIGETESGKTWLALASVAAELVAGQCVLYIHYEEADAESTIERLRLLGVSDSLISTRLRFVAPARAVRQEWLEQLLESEPSLVVHDGVNEAMSLHSAEIKDADGASAFRRRLITPCLKVGAATLACDHMPMGSDGSRRDAFGSVHKGNALNGARIALENSAPFGRRMRGVSYVFVTKDRPGQLRAHGRSTKTPGKTFMGTFIVDDSQAFSPDLELKFFAPKDDDKNSAQRDPASELADTVHEVIAAHPGRRVASQRMLYAAMRKAGHQFTEAKVADAVDDLIVDCRLIESIGKNRSKGYEAVISAAEERQT